LGCIIDQFGLDVYGFVQLQFIEGCEVFSSVAGSAGTRGAIFGNVTYVFGCNIHDVINIGTIGNSFTVLFGTIIAKGLTTGVSIASGSGTITIDNCTIDGNAGDAILLLGGSITARILNCIISNQTAGGKYGINNQQAIGTLLYSFADHNSFYNNTANLNNQPQGVHDTLLGSNPYVGQSTENYTLA
jgi:hypothetical protein